MEVFLISDHSFWDDLGGFQRHPDLVTRLAKIGLLIVFQFNQTNTMRSILFHLVPLIDL